MVGQYYVYIATNQSRTLYTGVTRNLDRRMYEHRWKVTQGFMARYNIASLVYFETTNDVRAAIEREKQIKGWTRAKKIALIESVNPEWRDLSLEWYAAVCARGGLPKGMSDGPTCHSERSEESPGARRRTLPLRRPGDASPAGSA